MRFIIAFILLSLVKFFSRLFYKCEVEALNFKGPLPWKEIKLIALLNHTSLFEPLYLQVIPYHYLWHLAKHLRAPGASKTLDRPIVGRFWKMMTPTMTSISRKRDNTWDEFLQSINQDSVIVIAPEGRMKRPNGLDAFGKPMNVKPGIAEILTEQESGKMLLAFSGGLHHVQSPGERVPRFFKTIKLNLELHNISDYKKSFSPQSSRFKLDVVHDLEKRITQCCPKI